MIDQSLAHEPDCLILDWELPDLHEPDDLSTLPDLLPGLKIIVTSTRPEAAEAAASVHADAFICKTDPPAEILSAIRHLNGKD